MVEFILASQSPRRRQLLTLTHYPFQVIAADVDEESIMNPDPAGNAIETAVLKASHLQTTLPPGNQLILAADTIVAIDDHMLGKPADNLSATRMLQQLRNRTHAVHTGLCLIDRTTQAVITAVHSARVTMRNYGDGEIDAYVKSGDPFDKAGAYAIQHPVFQPVSHLDGCYLGVMGLSICHLLSLLAHMKIPNRASLTAVHNAHQQFPCPVLTTFQQTGEF